MKQYRNKILNLYPAVPNKGLTVSSKEFLPGYISICFCIDKMGGDTDLNANNVNRNDFINGPRLLISSIFQKKKQTKSLPLQEKVLMRTFNNTIVAACTFIKKNIIPSNQI